jgi:DNA adenine methylase
MCQCMSAQELKRYPYPFLRWAGGKRWLVESLVPQLPRDFTDYYEPFLGAGTLFFAIRPKRAFLSDSNEELMRTYQQLKEDSQEIIKWLKTLRNTKTGYYHIRKSKVKNPARFAARFIFLNKACWNGLYRVNRRGEFNVPYGNKQGTEIYVEENLKAVSKALADVALMVCDFEESLKMCKKRDLIYLDPPYTVAHEKNGFLKYNSKIFSWEDQIRLAAIVEGLHARGCYVVISNAYHSSILNLYKNFAVQKLTRASIISGEASGRRRIHEALIKNF